LLELVTVNLWGVGPDTPLPWRASNKTPASLKIILGLDETSKLTGILAVPFAESISIFP
jgi:hypothetical protein